MRYIPVILTLLLVTYGQLIIKYSINQLGPIPTDHINSMISYFFKALTNMGIVSGLLSAVLAALSWMAALSKNELSSVYPILSLNFILVPLFSVWLFGESINAFKIGGIIVIILGVVLFSKGL